jgi:hypothetical protein
MIQIHNVADALHRRLKSRKIEELRARLARRSTVTLSIDTADAVRAERDSR